MQFLYLPLAQHLNKLDETLSWDQACIIHIQLVFVIQIFNSYFSTSEKSTQFSKIFHTKLRPFQSAFITQTDLAADSSGCSCAARVLWALHGIAALALRMLWFTAWHPSWLSLISSGPSILHRSSDFGKTNGGHTLKYSVADASQKGAPKMSCWCCCYKLLLLLLLLLFAHLRLRGPHTRDILQRSDTLHYTGPNLW